MVSGDKAVFERRSVGLQSIKIYSRSLERGKAGQFVAVARSSLRGIRLPTEAGQKVLATDSTLTDVD